MNTNGEHVGGSLGFLVGLNKLVRENKPTDIIVVWDGEGGSLKRRSMFKDYKAGRKLKVNREYDFENPDAQMESFRDQLGILDHYLDYLPVSTYRCRGLEADDVIAYLSIFLLDKEAEKIIVSTDKDFYQLLNSKTSVYSPAKKKFFSSSDLKETLDILPENFIYMKALMGDKSDNIAGIKGVGAKTVMKLFPFLGEREIGMEDIFDHAQKNKDVNSKYKSILSAREIVINNVALMDLSSPLMDPMSARSIREQFGNTEVKYKPTDMKLQLHKDGIQLKPSDFFIVFKEHSFRSRIGEL
jgi:DNA polymerase-1